MEFSVDTTIAVVRVKWRDAAVGVFTGKALLNSLRRIGLRLQRTMMQKVSNDVLQVRTGNLRRAIFYRVEGSEQSREVLVRAGANLTKAIYGRIQDVGGTITPRRAQFLTIPFGPNRTTNGVMRVDAREFISNPGSIGFTGSFVNRRKTAILGVRADGSVEPVFALVRFVRIKPTGYLANSLAETMPFIQEEMNLAADEVMKEMGDGSR